MMGVVCVKRGIAAGLAAVVVAGAVMVATFQQQDSMEALPASSVVDPSEARAHVRDVSRSALRDALDTPDPLTQAQAAAAPSAIKDGKLFPEMALGDDPFLPRPVDESETYAADEHIVKVDGGGKLAVPVEGRISSPFGMRKHPVLGYYRMHTGIDYANACGTPIGAAADGVVTQVGWSGGYGYMVTIDHGEVNGYNLVTYYAHLSSSSVSVGQHVTRQQGIARVGTTGLSSGCHLHFEVRANGQITDPAYWLGNGDAVVFADSMVERPAGSGNGGRDTTIDSSWGGGEVYISGQHGGAAQQQSSQPAPQQEQPSQAQEPAPAQEAAPSQAPAPSQEAAPADRSEAPAPQPAPSTDE